ncbi:hypothetical protein L210DRAFT_3652516 [Boletus edulis BED1]|uniref:DUF7330 domain-containing protein n=1 Tax=Boletus edulis BED1 TaxID=1328754 RepID=A0AAD4G8Y5_BOLED|nr:hypothetical protein L210DRAFT_3652516 [Boletus edulis BED1]
MIVTPGDQPSKQSSDQKVQFGDVNPDEPPPSYSPHIESPPIASGSTLSSTPTYKSKPTNFLSLSNSDSSICGEFVIDPSIRIPSSILPPLRQDDTEDDRKNLNLRSQNSSVNADIWLLGTPSSQDPESAIGADKPRRTTIALISDHGSIRAQVHTLDDAAPFLLTARANHGTIRLAVPRSFHGLLSLSTRHGSTSLSDTLVENATQLSQIDDTRRYFIGDFQALGEVAWEGDLVELDATHGSLRVKYIDEVEETHAKKGFLSRLFGK